MAYNPETGVQEEDILDKTVDEPAADSVPTDTTVDTDTPGRTGTPSTSTTAGKAVSNATGEQYDRISEGQLGQDEPDWAGYDAAGAGDELDANVDFKEAEINDTSTVSGQLAGLLDENSAYIQAAKTGAKEQAASRGMLNSSMAAGQAQRAAIEAGLPIAQQDAKTHADAQALKQGAEYDVQKMQAEGIVSGKIVEQEASIQHANQKIQNAFQSQMAGAEAEGKVWLQDMQNSYNQGMKTLEFNQNRVLQSVEITANKAAQFRELSAQVTQNYQIQMEALFTDPGFQDMANDDGTTSEAQQNIIDGLRNYTNGQIKFLGNQAGLSTGVNNGVKWYLGG